MTTCGHKIFLKRGTAVFSHVRLKSVVFVSEVYKIYSKHIPSKLQGFKSNALKKALFKK